jgi:uncharacterized membrane protein
MKKTLRIFCIVFWGLFSITLLTGQMENITVSEFIAFLAILTFTILVWITVSNPEKYLKNNY